MLPLSTEYTDVQRYRVSFDLPAQRKYWTRTAKDFRESIEGINPIPGVVWRTPIPGVEGIFTSPIYLEK